MRASIVSKIVEADAQQSMRKIGKRLKIERGLTCVCLSSVVVVEKKNCRDYDILDCN